MYIANVHHKQCHTLCLKRNAPWILWLPLWPRVILLLINKIWNRSQTTLLKNLYKAHLSTLFPKRNATFQGAFLLRLSVHEITESHLKWKLNKTWVSSWKNTTESVVWGLFLYVNQLNMNAIYYWVDIFVISKTVLIQAELRTQNLHPGRGN